MALSAAPVMGQDLLARQAPVDRKMKAVDSFIFDESNDIHHEKKQNLSKQ